MKCSSIYRGKNTNSGCFVKGSLNNCSSKSVVQLDKDNNLLNTYPSIAEAYRQTGINKACISISMVIHGVHKTAGGFKWKKMEN